MHIVISSIYQKFLKTSLKLHRWYLHERNICTVRLYCWIETFKI